MSLPSPISLPFSLCFVLRYFSFCASFSLFFCVLLYFCLCLSISLSLSFYLLTSLLLSSSFPPAFRDQEGYQTPTSGVTQAPGLPPSLQMKSPVGVMAPGRSSAPGKAKSPLQDVGCLSS